MHTTINFYKHAFDGDFDAQLKKWLRMLDDLMGAKTPGERLLVMLRYLAALCDNTSGREFEQTLRELYPGKAEKVMPSVLEDWIERGKKQGFREGRQEGREEGRYEGSLLTARRAVLDAVEARFGTVPREMTQLLSGVTEEEKLLAMHREAVKAPTPDELTRRLKEMA